MNRWAGENAAEKSHDGMGGDCSISRGRLYTGSVFGSTQQLLSGTSAAGAAE
jgi:hypothetical protein